MNRPLLHRLAATIGIASAALLLWLWFRGGEAVPNAPPENAPPTTVAAWPAPVALAAPSDVRSAKSRADLRALLSALARGLARPDIRPNEAVLTFNSDEALRRFTARAHARGLSILGRLDGLRTVRVRFADAAGLETELREHADDYAAADANGLFVVPQPPAREDRAAFNAVPFGNRALGFIGAENNSTWGRGITIAVLDTGVAADATFAHRLRTLDLGLGVTPGDGGADGHGTAVASLAAGAAADAAGVAPAASILGIRVTDTNGASDLFTVAQAIVAAVDAGARIVNISLGGSAGGAVLDAALAYAAQRDSVVVAAAGNDQAAQLAWPAADPRVVSVGAVDASGQQVAFSNSGAQLQLAAPGYGVQTAWLDGERAQVNGTSASAPLVAGAIAAVLSQSPGLTPTQAAQVLLQTASEAGPPGADPAYGHGILNAGWAINRQNIDYVDTAVASHVYDAATNQLQTVVQNRSGRTVTGLTLEVTTGTTTTRATVPSLGPGESYVARSPVDQIALRASGSIAFTTQLVNPLGVTDRVPANNQRSTVLTAPGKP